MIYAKKVIVQYFLQGIVAAGLTQYRAYSTDEVTFPPLHDNLEVRTVDKMVIKITLCFYLGCCR